MIALLAAFAVASQAAEAPSPAPVVVDAPAPASPTAETAPEAAPQAAPAPAPVGLAPAPTSVPDVAPAAVRPAGTMVRRSLASTVWPVEPAFAAGFSPAPEAFLPWAGLSLFVPVLPGLGPVVVGRAVTGGVGSASLVEGFVGAGPAIEGLFGTLRGRAALVPALRVTSVAGSETTADNVTSAGFAVVAPLELGVPLGSGVSFTVSLEPGVTTAVSATVDGASVRLRDRFFVLVGGGLTFGGPVD